MNERLLTAEEVAELLALPVSWVRESTRSGAMPCVELGRYRRYDRAAVEASLESRSKPGPADQVTSGAENAA
jgi:excisionase family DNA binding protein